LVIIIPALIVGWYAVRERVLAIAQEREGFTGQFPVVANRPPPRQKDDER
jgi:L-asparagine permease